MKKKIVHLQLFPLLSGVQRVSLDELSILNSDSYEKYLICKENGPLTEQAALVGVNVITVPQLVRSISFFSDLVALVALIRIFKHHKFDIIHTHSSKTGVLGRLAARICGVKKIIHTVHGFSFPAAKSKLEYFLFLFLEWLGAKCATQIICLNDGDYDICDMKLGCDSSKLRLISNGVDCEKFKPFRGDGQLRSELDLSPSDVVLVMVGRLWEQKDPMTLLSAFHRVVSTHSTSKLKLMYIGDGPLRALLEGYVLENHLTNLVLFKGWAHDVQNILPCADIFVLPSLWEGMPLAILEAMACGLPCLVSDIQGNNSLVEHGENGICFPAQDVSALAEAIFLLYSDSSLRLGMGVKAREIACNQYSIHKRMERVLKVYEG